MKKNKDIDIEYTKVAERTKKIIQEMRMKKMLIILQNPVEQMLLLTGITMMLKAKVQK